MAIYYKNQSEIELLSATTGVSSNRLSELRRIMYGGRGSKFDELHFLREHVISENPETVPNTTNLKLSDNWLSFGAHHGPPASRADKARRDFFKFGVFP